MIKRNDYNPIYMQLHDILRDKLPEYPIGSNIPPERVLCETYNLDRITVRKALSLLSEEGYIQRKQGSGTRVLRHTLVCSERILFLLSHGYHMVDRRGEPFYAYSLEALESQLKKMDKQLLYSKVFPTDNLSTLCEGLDAKAIILAGEPDKDILAQCANLKIPLIGYNTFLPGFPSVFLDNESGAAASAQHLIKLGHQEIGFIHVPNTANSTKRLWRFKIELAEAGMPADCLHIVTGDWTEHSGYTAAKELLSADGPRVTAIFAGNDSMAMGALCAAKEMGLRVPEDLSIIGFDGIAQTAKPSYGAASAPALTTSRVDIDAMAEAACMLLDHIFTHGINHSIHTMVSTEFFPGGTIGPAPVQNASPEAKEPPSSEK